jgi:hypothetical protein
MSKVSNSSKQVEKVNKTSKSPLRKLQPILVKSIGSVILAGFSLLIKYQLPQVVITISTNVCQSHQEHKTLIRVDFSTRDVNNLGKSMIPSVNNRE